MLSQTDILVTKTPPPSDPMFGSYVYVRGTLVARHMVYIDGVGPARVCVRLQTK